MTPEQQASSLLRVLNALQALDASSTPEDLAKVINAYMAGLEGYDPYYDLSTLFGIVLDLIPDVNAFVNDVVELS